MVNGESSKVNFLENSLMTNTELPIAENVQVSDTTMMSLDTMLVTKILNN
jgi:hypothetical protein